MLQLLYDLARPQEHGGLVCRAFGWSLYLYQSMLVLQMHYVSRSCIIMTPHQPPPRCEHGPKRRMLSRRITPSKQILETD